MKLIIGLGNPGAKYIDTRHNFGFTAVEATAERFDARWVKKSKFQAEIAEVGVPVIAKKPLAPDFDPGNAKQSMDRHSDELPHNDVTEKVIFAKPQTFYNLSGQAVRAIKDFYHIDNNDILVVHDEMALPVGTLRTRLGGSDAGNNGVKNIIEHLGKDFARIRIGSGCAPTHDGAAKPNANYCDHVLSRPTKVELKKLKQLEPEIQNLIDQFIKENFATTTHKVS